MISNGLRYGAARKRDGRLLEEHYWSVWSLGHGEGPINLKCSIATGVDEVGGVLRGEKTSEATIL